MDRGLSRAGRLGGLLVPLLLVGWAALGAGFIDWEAELVASLSGPTFGIGDSSTVFSGGYYWGDVEGISQGGMSYGSVGTFGENGSGIEGTIRLPLPATTKGTVDVTVYHKTDLVIDWPVGTWGILTSAMFSLETSELSRFSTTANVTAYGTSTTATFSLVPMGGAYATGLTLELSGTTLSGMGLSLTASFGGPPGLPPAQPCTFDFRGFAVGLEGFPWGCVHTDIDLTFGHGGFELAEIDVDIDLWDGLLTLDGSLEFAVDEKRLSLIQRIHVNQGCIWFNVAVEPAEVGPGSPNPIDSLVLRGLGISSCDVGTSDFSLIASIAGGLYKSRGTADIDLHAGGYYIALDPAANPAQYEQTDYSMVWTVEQGFLNATWAVDAYFGTNGGTLFNLALITAEWEQQLATGFEVRLAFQIDPAGLAHTLLFGLTASVLLP